MNSIVKLTSLAVLAGLCVLAAGSADAKGRGRRCICPEKTEYEPPCEGRTTYVRRVVERRTVYVEPAAAAYVAYPAYGYGYPYAYQYGYGYGGAGIVDAGYVLGVGFGGWGW
jgi:hypothetical protein